MYVYYYYKYIYRGASFPKRPSAEKTKSRPSASNRAPSFRFLTLILPLFLSFSRSLTTNFF